MSLCFKAIASAVRSEAFHGHSHVAASFQMMRVELVKFNKRYGFAKMRGTCHVGPNLVCEADLNLVMGK